MLDLAGIGVPLAMQGESLAPCLLGGEAPACEAAITENDDEFFGPLMRTITTRSWKMTRCAGQVHGELFDHRGDPQEFRNPQDDRGYSAQRSMLTGLLLDETMALARLRATRHALYA